MKISGGILEIRDLEVFSSGKKKRSIVVYTREKVSRHFEINFYDDNIYQLDKLSTRDSVVISFTLESEVFDDGKTKAYFTHIIGIEILDHKYYR